MNFEPLVDLIRLRTGVEVPSPAPQFEQAVGQRLLELKCPSVAEYVSLLTTKGLAEHEWSVAINFATNRLTHFMRDEEQIEAAMALAVHARQLHNATPVRIWSAGCSTGEEPYSLVILALEAGLEVQVVATDVNPLVIDSARRGRFAAWTLRRVPEGLRQRYFDEVTPNTFKVKREVAERVLFRVNNLVTDTTPELAGEHQWHMVICRNVLIYYCEETIARILLKMSRAIEPCGFLVLGASETVAQRRLPLTPCLAFGRIVYGSPTSGTSSVRLQKLPSVNDLSERGSRSNVPESLRSPGRVPAPNVAHAEPIDESAHAELPESYLQIQDALLQCLENNRTSAVLEALQGVVDSNPDDIHARLSLGHMHLREHRFDEARLHYEAALSLDDCVAEPHFFLGLLYKKLRQPDKAIDALRRTVFLEPTFWAATYLLATTAQRHGQLELSRLEFQRTADLLESSRGSLPLLTHPLFHTQFLEPAAEVLRSAREALESMNGP